MIRPGSTLFSRRAAVAAIRILGVGAVVTLGQLLSPSPASACDVGIGYKPSISFTLEDGLTGKGECSTGTSLTGMAILVVLVLAVLAAVLKTLVDRGASRVSALAAGSTGTSQEGEDGEQVLTRYLDSVGIGRTGEARPQPDPPAD